MWLYFAADDQHCDSVECESKKVGPVSTDLLVSLRVMDGHCFKACSQVRQTLRSWTQSFAAALPKLDNVQLCKTQSERCKVEDVMLTHCQDHVLTENIWFVLSNHIVEIKRKCHYAGQTNNEDRAR